MLYVVPFVAKVIESSAKSKVFKPPNPWVMAIMAVLVELHQVPDLKVSNSTPRCLHNKMFSYLFLPQFGLVTVLSPMNITMNHFLPLTLLLAVKSEIWSWSPVQYPLTWDEGKSLFSLISLVCSLLVKMFQHFIFFFKEIKASELLKDPEKLKHIPHQLSSPEKDKQRKCLLFATLPFAEYHGIIQISFLLLPWFAQCLHFALPVV